MRGSTRSMRSRYARVRSTGDSSRAAIRRPASATDSLVRSSLPPALCAFARAAASTAVAAAPAMAPRRVIVGSSAFIVIPPLAPPEDSPPSLSLLWRGLLARERCDDISLGRVGRSARQRRALRVLRRRGALARHGFSVRYDVRQRDRVIRDRVARRARRIRWAAVAEHRRARIRARRRARRLHDVLVVQP